MSKSEQIAYRAREVSKAKTNLLRMVVSERMTSAKPTAEKITIFQNDTGKLK